MSFSVTRSRRRHLVPTRMIVLLFVASLTAAACGQSGAETPPLPAGPTPTVTVPIEMPAVISIAGAFDEQTLDVLEAQITAFEAGNPDVLVEIVAPPGSGAEFHEEAASLLAQGDTTRDVFVVPVARVAELAAQGGLLPLDAYLERAGIELGHFFPAAAASVEYDGAVAALPWTADGGLLYYRRDLLEGMGLGPPETWEELAEIARQGADSAGVPYGFVWQGAAYDGLTCNTLEFVWAAGGQVLDASGQPVFDSPETVDGLRFMQGLVESGVSPAEVATFREAATLSAFQEGRALFMRNLAYAWQRLQAADSEVAGRVGVTPLPASCIAGQVLVLSASSQHPDEAFRFMAFLLAPEQQAQLALEGVQPPALMAVYRDDALLTQAPVLADFYRGLLAAHPRPQSPEYPAISEVIYTEVNAMLRGLQAPEATAAAIETALERIVDGQQ